MKKISGLLLLGFALLSNTVFSQTYADLALYYSRIRPGGSARIQAMGGTQVSLGGDYSSATSNPAGLGMYNKSELAFSPSLAFSKVGSDYLDNASNASKNTFSLPGFSIAFHKDYDRTEGFLGGTFSITYNRVNDFNQDLTYQGTNSNSSIIDYFINQANGNAPADFEQGGYLYNDLVGLAWENYLFEPDPNQANTYYPPLTSGIPFQKETVQTRGAQNQWNFSYGANFNDKFFLGGGIGISSLRFKSKKMYSENFTIDQDQKVKSILLEENLDISGSGVNVNVGGIYRPIDHLQLGLSVSSPTFYQITDTYSATLSSRWDNFQYNSTTLLNNVSVQSDVIVSEYNINTPWKLSAGATYFFGKQGLISFDVEQMSYNNAKYKSANSNSYTASDAQGDNEKIKTLYKNTTNFRVGGEYRLKAFRFRAGGNYMGDPYAQKQNGVNRSIVGVSGGVGYRTSNFYIDLAVTNYSGKNSYRPYSVPNDSPLVKYNQNNTNVMVTLGFPF